MVRSVFIARRPRWGNNKPDREPTDTAGWTTAVSPSLTATRPLRRIDPIGFGLPGWREATKPATPRQSLGRRLSIFTVVAISALLGASRSYASTPVLPANGATVPATPTFQVSFGEGESVNYAAVRATEFGANIAQCTFTITKQTSSSGSGSCTLSSPLLSGTYSWWYTGTLNGRGRIDSGGTFTVPGATPASATTTTTTATTPTLTVAPAAPAVTTPLVVTHAAVKLRVTSHLCVGKTCAGRVGKRLLEYRLVKSRSVFVRWLS